MVALYLLAFLQVLDILTTHYALRTGKGVEGNPLLAKLFDRFGHEPVLIATKGAFLAPVWYFRELIHPYALWALCVFYVWVVWNNVKHIRSH